MNLSSVNFRAAASFKGSAASAFSGLDLTKAVNEGSNRALKTAGAAVFNTFIAAPVRFIYRTGSKVLHSSYLRGDEFTKSTASINASAPKRIHLDDSRFKEFFDGLAGNLTKKSKPAAAAVKTAAAPAKYPAEPAKAYISGLPGGQKFLNELQQM